MTPVTTLNGDVTASYGKAVTENLSRINAVTTETTVTTSSAIKLGKYRRYHTAAYTGDKFGNGPAGGYTGYVLDIIGSSGGYSVTAIAAVVTRRRHPAAIIVGAPIKRCAPDSPNAWLGISALSLAVAAAPAGGQS